MSLETSQPQRPSRPHYDDPKLIPPGLVTQRELLDAGLEAVQSAVATMTLNGERELLYERTRAIARVVPTNNPKPVRSEPRVARMESAPVTRIASSAAYKRVQDLLDREDVLILDTETTGGGPRSEIIEVALIDTTGATRFESLVRPTSRIQPGAQRVHGLSRSDLELSPSWTELDEAFRELVRFKTVLAYNVSFDRGMVRQTRERYELRSSLEIVEWACAMRIYAATIGRGSIGLERAAKLEGVLQGAQSHRAMGDVKLTLALLRAAAKRQESQ
jgi:DNA polymerase III epsilon subunit-like protein